jgi:G3E family GTPase
VKWRLPIYLVSGFLGSGKTTLLKGIYRSNRNRRLIYLINDFSFKDVDAQVFGENDAEIIAVPGGSIFCTCLVTEFVSRMNEILKMHAETEYPVEGVVIEASGMANPSIITGLLRDSELDKSFEIRSIISVTDPVSLPKLLQTLPNIRQQIAVADRIVLNKIDLVTPEELQQVEVQIRKINETASLEKTTYCTTNWDIAWLNGFIAGSSGESAHPPQTAFAKFSLRSRKPPRIEKITQLIKDYHSSIYRIKGFIPGVSGEINYIDYSLSSGLNLTETGNKIEPHVEFIFDGSQADKIRNAIKDLINTESDK